MGGIRHRYRLVVGSSFDSRLVEVVVRNDGICAVSRHASAWVTTRKRKRKPAGAWLTSVVFHQGSLYACQYQKRGVLRFDGEDLAFKGVVAAGNRMSTPEGLAFAQGHMFVASAEGGCVIMFDKDGREVASTEFTSLVPGQEPDLVPWGMAVGPDGALYVALDQGYTPLGNNYAVPPPPCISCGEKHRNGTIVRIELVPTISTRSDGAASAGNGRLRFGTMTTFCEGLSRPNGMAFTEGGELLVASLDLQVSRFAGPASPTPGAYLGVFYSLIKRNNTPRRIQARNKNNGMYYTTCPDLQCFDIHTPKHQGGVVFVSIHSGMRKGDPHHDPQEDGLVVCDKDGREIGFIHDACFSHPNCITGE